MRRVRLAALVTALALAGTGCAGTSGPSTTSSTTSPTTATTTVTQTITPTPATSTPAGFALSTVTSATFPTPTGSLIGAGVRVGQQDGYDRIVYDFTGTGVPGFRVAYVDTPIGDPSGERVTVLGDAYLEVLIAGLTYPEASDPQPSQVPASSLAGTVIAQSGVFYGGFEAMGQTFIGVRDHKRAFRVFTLTDPTRLVVDVAH